MGTRSHLWLSALLQRELQAYASLASPLETGGLLIGYLAGRDIVVTCIVGPGSGAKHRKFAFEPDNDYQQLELERVYQESGRHETYLGDWHSHPSGPDRLSSRDRETLRSIAEHEPARIARPVMLLVVGASQDWSLVGFRAASSRWWQPLRIQRLNCRIY